MIEPFRALDSTLRPHLNVLRRKSFTGRTAGVRGYGLEPMLAVNDSPEEKSLKVCAPVLRNGTAIRPMAAGRAVDSQSRPEVAWRTPRVRAARR
jgi:hypothetical protein